MAEELLSDADVGLLPEQSAQPDNLLSDSDVGLPAILRPPTPQFGAARQVLGRFAQAAAGGVAGALESIPIAATALASKFGDSLLSEADERDVTSRPLYRAGRAIRSAAEEAFPVDPNRPKSFLVDTLPQAAGSMAAFMAGGAAGKLAKASGAATVAALGAGVGGADAFDEAKKAGANDEDAFKVFAINAGLGTTEAVPIGGWLNRLNRASGNKLKLAIKEGSQEAIQEIVQTYGGNLTAQKYYDPNRPWHEGIIEGGGAGFTLGSVVSLLVSGIGGRRARIQTGVGERGEAVFAPAVEQSEPISTTRPAVLAPPNVTEVQNAATRVETSVEVGEEKPPGLVPAVPTGTPREIQKPAAVPAQAPAVEEAPVVFDSMFGPMPMFRATAEFTIPGLEGPAQSVGSKVTLAALQKAGLKVPEAELAKTASVNAPNKEAGAATGATLTPISVEPPAAVKPVETKEPWQMSKAEFGAWRNSLRDRRIELNDLLDTTKDAGLDTTAIQSELNVIQEHFRQLPEGDDAAHWQHVTGAYSRRLIDSHPDYPKLNPADAKAELMTPEAERRVRTLVGTPAARRDPAEVQWARDLADAVVKDLRDNPVPEGEANRRLAIFGFKLGDIKDPLTPKQRARQNESVQKSQEAFDKTRRKEPLTIEEHDRLNDFAKQGYVREGDRYVYISETKPAAPVATPTPATPVAETSGETIADRMSGKRSATIGTVTSDAGVFSLSVRPDNSAGGLSVVLSNKDGSQSIRMNYRYDMTLAEMQKRFQEYLNIDNPGTFTVEISQPKPAAVAKETAPQTLKQTWKRQLKEKQAIRYKTASDERAIERLKAKIANDPSKWAVGDGIGYRVNSGRGTQVNRGFRIVDVDPDAETVTVRQVADTGLTSSGGNQDRIGDTVIDMVDLVRDNNYTAKQPAAAAAPAQKTETFEQRMAREEDVNDWIKSSLKSKRPPASSEEAWNQFTAFDRARGVEVTGEDYFKSAWEAFSKPTTQAPFTRTENLRNQAVAEVERQKGEVFGGGEILGQSEWEEDYGERYPQKPLSGIRLRPGTAIPVNPKRSQMARARKVSEISSRNQNAWLDYMMAQTAAGKPVRAEWLQSAAELANRTDRKTDAETLLTRYGYFKDAQGKWQKPAGVETDSILRPPPEGGQPARPTEPKEPTKPGGEPAANFGTGLAEGRGMSSDEARAAIAGESTGGFEVEFISKVRAEELTDKPEARGYGGFFWKGKIYLVHENMARGDVAGAKALLREEVGHGLLRTVEGGKQLRAVLNAGKLQLTESEKQALRDQGYGEANLLDEFIAKSARENLPWWKAAVEQVRVWLSKVGLANLTNEEVARLLLKQIRRANESTGNLPGERLVTRNAVITAPGVQPAAALTAHHGTPHKVDRFSTEKIGTGEGAQVYGWGLYFAENPAVAKEYRETIGRAIRVFKNNKWYVEQGGKQVAGPFTREDQAFNASKDFQGQEYTVSLNVEPEEFLDWDKPLSEQSEKVKAALKTAGVYSEYSKQEPSPGAIERQNSGNNLYTSLRALGNPEIKRRLDAGEQNIQTERIASEYLASLGIKGIRYLDQGSRVTSGGEIISVFQQDGKWFAKVKVSNRSGIGFTSPTDAFTTSKPYSSKTEAEAWAKETTQGGTYNYVIFSDKDIAITHENGKEVPLAEAMGTSTLESAASQLPELAPGQPTGEARAREEEVRKGEAFTSLGELSDELGVIQPEEGEAGVPTRVGGDVYDMVMSRPGLNAAVRADSVANAQNALAETGLVVEQGEDGLFRLADEFTQQEVEGQRLVTILEREIQSARAENRPERIANLLNSVVVHLTRDKNKAFSQELKNALYALAQGERSTYGRALGGLAMWGKVLANVAMNPALHLNRLYSDMYGGELVRKIMNKIVSNFGEPFTGEEIERLYNNNPKLRELFDKVVDRLKVKPSLREVIQEIFATPIYKQDDLVEKFVDTMVNKFSATADEASRLKAEFNNTFEASFKGARQKALENALKDLTPQEARAIGSGTPLWDKIRNLVNAGGFDPGSILQQRAREAGWTVPTEREMAQMRGWAAKEQQLREPTQRQIDAETGTDAEKLAKATKKAEVGTESERLALIKKIQASWSRWSMPISWKPWHWSAPVAKARAKAINEFVGANLLFKFGFAVRQWIDVGLVSMPLNAVNRTLVHALERGTIKDLDAATREMAVARVSSFTKMLRQAERTLTGHTNRRVLDRMTSSVGIFERMMVKADALEAKGNMAGARAVRLATVLQAGYRIAAVWDSIQSVGLEWQEMRQQLSTELRKQGKPQSAINIDLDEVFGGLKIDMVQAMEEARMIGLERGLTKDNATLQQDAWNLVKAKAYDRMRAVANTTTDYATENEQYRELHSWNLPETGGIGGVIAGGIRAIKTKTEEMGVPTGGLLSFGNAMGIAANRIATFSGGGLFGGFGFGDSPWYQGSRNIRQRRIEAVQGLAVIGIMVGLAAAGKIIVQIKYPEDKDEKEKFIAEGHKLNTIRFVQDDGKWIEYPIQMSPFSFIASPLYMIGGVQALLTKQHLEQERLNADAKRTGNAPGKAKEVDAGDVAGVVAQGIYGLLTGGRTASGAIQSFSDYGEFNLNKSTARIVSPYLPGIPAWQEASRAMGAAMDTRTATMLELLTPSPWSGHQRVNSLGDPMVNPNDAVRVLQVLTGGVGFGSDKDLKDNHAYQQLFSAGYSAPDVGRSKGYSFDGTIRPMTPQELEKYTVARGKAFKQELGSVDVTGLAPKEAKAIVQNAFQRANSAALNEVGATPARVSTARSVISDPSESAGAPRGLSMTASRTGERRYGLSAIRPIRLSTRSRGRTRRLSTRRSRVSSPRLSVRRAPRGTRRISIARIRRPSISSFV